MISKLKFGIVPSILATIVAFVMVLGLSFSVSAQSVQGSLCEGADTLQWSGSPSDSNCTTTNDASETVNTTVALVINIFSWIVGVVSVIMIIWGGFKYITSGGDSNNVTAAKNTILYAIIGLVIVALAQVIVRFVLSTATGAAV